MNSKKKVYTDHKSTCAEIILLLFVVSEAPKPKCHVNQAYNLYNIRFFIH